eukprot:PhM_4_TR16149/c3_g1_i1/m.20945
MMMRACIAAAAILLVIAMTSAPTAEAVGYGSYSATCVNDTVVFTNFKDDNCQGNSTTFSSVLNKCLPDLVVMSWNAFCNSTAIWYNNFLGTSCSGNSVMTRKYCLRQCYNCEGADCKHWFGPVQCPGE